MRIVIPGGSGQVGQVLARHFHQRRQAVTVLSRAPRSTPWKTILWDAHQLGPWTNEIDGADVIINLTGRNVNCRYIEANRREILESRVNSTRILGQAIALADHAPRLWINASTATIYRHSLDRDMDDVAGELGGSEAGAPSTWRFSIDVATQWERAFCEAATPRTRKAALRSAMTMSPDRGGIFDVLLRLVRFGLGGAIGSGEQYISWIHESDFIRAVELVMSREDLTGTVNIASPNPMPQREFMRILRKACGIPIGLPASEWMVAIGAFFLRTETELILKSRRVVPKKLTDAGFVFEYADWSRACAELVTRSKTRSVR